MKIDLHYAPKGAWLIYFDQGSINISLLAERKRETTNSQATQRAVRRTMFIEPRILPNPTSSFRSVM